VLLVVFPSISPNAARIATKHGITVVRVPAYSPCAVAEHTIALMLNALGAAAD